MQRKSQNNLVKELILSCINKGMTELCSIYDEIETRTGIPRPTIRRITSDLRVDLQKQIDVLSQNQKPLIVN